MEIRVLWDKKHAMKVLQRFLLGYLQINIVEDT